MAYPTVNYIGNKEKIVNWIASLIPADATSFLDVFCGGCSVGYMAKEKGLTVYANDILKINYYIAQALIENNDKTIDDKERPDEYGKELLHGIISPVNLYPWYAESR